MASYQGHDDARRYDSIAIVRQGPDCDILAVEKRTKKSGRGYYSLQRRKTRPETNSEPLTKATGNAQASNKNSKRREKRLYPARRSRDSSYGLSEEGGGD